MANPIVDFAMSLACSSSIFAVSSFGLICTVRLIYKDIVLWRTCRRSNKWLNVEGRVLTSEVVMSSAAKGVHHNPVVTYSFVLNGRKYRGDRRLFDFGSSYTQKEAAAIVAKFARRSMVTVYYDPNRPASCTLERIHRGLGGELWVICVLLFVSLLFTGVGIGGFVTIFSSKTRR